MFDCVLPMHFVILFCHSLANSQNSYNKSFRRPYKKPMKYCMPTVHQSPWQDTNTKVTKINIFLSFNKRNLISCSVSKCGQFSNFAENRNQECKVGAVHVNWRVVRFFYECRNKAPRLLPQGTLSITVVLRS